MEFYCFVLFLITGNQRDLRAIFSNLSFMVIFFPGFSLKVWTENEIRWNTCSFLSLKRNTMSWRNLSWLAFDLILGDCYQSSCLLFSYYIILYIWRSLSRSTKIIIFCTLCKFDYRCSKVVKLGSVYIECVEQRPHRLTNVSAYLGRDVIPCLSSAPGSALRGRGELGCCRRRRTPTGDLSGGKLFFFHDSTG